MTDPQPPAPSDAVVEAMAASTTPDRCTAMVYPTLLAAIGDVAHPAWRVPSASIACGATADSPSVLSWPA